jgi:hypothetical protein
MVQPFSIVSAVRPIGGHCRREYATQNWVAGSKLPEFSDFDLRMPHIGQEFRFQGEFLLLHS